MKRNRLANFELLRIIAMFGVLIGHYFNYGLHIYEDEYNDTFTVNVASIFGMLNWSTLELLKLITLVSVNCYILITGYFMASQTRLRIKGIWKVWSTTWIYSVCIYSLFLITNSASFSFDALLDNVAPIYSNTYWFVTSYLFIMLISPLLSYVAIKLTHRQYVAVLIVGFILCFQLFLGQFLVSEHQLPLFAYLYLIGGYIKKYQPVFSSRQLFWSCMGMLSILFAYTIYKNCQLQSNHFMIFAMYNHGLVLPFSVLVFLYFRQMGVPQKYHTLINAIAPLSFAVYIIHSQPNVHEMLWGYITSSVTGMNQWLILPHCIITCTFVFVLCIIMEKVRIQISNQVQKLLNK